MPEDWIETYKNLRPTYENLTSTMTELLTTLLKQEQIDYLHPIQSRTKSIASFEEKIARKKYKNPIKEITDLTGLRLIVYYSDEIPHLKDIIEENFEVDPKNTIDKGSLLSKDQFAYGGIHYVVSISKDRLKLSEYRAFRGMKFEIQLLTLCQYAWAEIQRKIEYKSEEIISPWVSRRLARLIALFELADDEFMSIRNQGFNVLKQASPSSISLKQFMHISKTLKTLMKQAYRESFIEMDTLEDNRYLGNLLEACSIVNLKNLAALESYLSSQANLSKFVQTVNKHGNPIIRIGPISLSLLLIYHSNEKFSSSFLSQRGWKEPVLSILLDR